MLRRFQKWNEERKHWTRDHTRTWAEAASGGQSAPSPFQRECESIIRSELRQAGFDVTGTDDESEDEQLICGKVQKLEWELEITPDTVGIWKASRKRRVLWIRDNTVVRMEEWDFRTPEEFYRALRGRLRSALEERK